VRPLCQLLVDYLPYSLFKELKSGFAYVKKARILVRQEAHTGQTTDDVKRKQLHWSRTDGSKETAMFNVVTSWAHSWKPEIRPPANG
jgi:hypothetical protein